MPFRKSLGVEIFDGPSGRTVVGDKEQMQLAQDGDKVLLASLNTRVQDGTRTTTIRLTKMEALVLSHELRKLAIGC